MTEVLGEEPITKLESSIAKALRRRPTNEPFLGGVGLALAPHSPRLLTALESVLASCVRRRSYERALYTAASRAIAENEEPRAVEHLAGALEGEDAGGLSTLSAAAYVKSAALSQPLARACTSRHPHVAMGAEVARVARGESNGQRSVAVAPKIKESHRIALCSELFVPLLQSKPSLPAPIAPSLGVLRASERHLGRWLVLAELAGLAGDHEPLAQAMANTRSGSSRTRAAWALAVWALQGDPKTPGTKPSLALVLRLSDRPSSDRDASFLFRLADAGLEGARPVLESMVRGENFEDGQAIRAAMCLARDQARDDLVERLAKTARSVRSEALRGLAAAALFDAGHRQQALAFAEELVNSPKLPTLGWAALIRAAGSGRLERIVTESSFRRVQLGWVQ